eukprot:1764688-Rhodomonas_salina.1
MSLPAPVSGLQVGLRAGTDARVRGRGRLGWGSARGESWRSCWRGGWCSRRPRDHCHVTGRPADVRGTVRVTVTLTRLGKRWLAGAGARSVPR